MSDFPQIVDIDIDVQKSNLNVPVLRQPRLTALINAFVSGIKLLQSDIKNNFFGNSAYSAWATATNYALNARRQYGIKSYECILPHLSSSLNAPPNSTYWYEISPDNIGITEKLNYNCSKMQLEYILNKRFNSITSIFPPYNSGAGNIYITNNYKGAPTLNSSIINSSVPSYVVTADSTSGWFCPTIAGYLAVLSGTNYTIFVPSAILATTGSGVADITGETNKYNAMGLTFNIQGY